MVESITIDLSFLDQYSELFVDKYMPFRFKCIDECRRDPKCCKGKIVLLPEDVSRLAKHFNLSNDDFFQKHCKLLYEQTPGITSGFYNVILKKNENGYCVLLNTSPPIKSCSVHGNLQPYLCQTFPVFFMGMNEYLIFMGKNQYSIRMCPGVRKGDLYTVEQWAKDNKTIEFGNGFRLIIANQIHPFKDDYNRLSQLTERKKWKKVRKLNNKIKMKQLKIIMKMFDIE